jgi:hypothetical protein
MTVEQFKWTSVIFAAMVLLEIRRIVGSWHDKERVLRFRQLVRENRQSSYVTATGYLL